jgi:adenylate cyclase
MTSNAILLGAEFDKMISILLVTGIIAVSLQRAKGLLVRAVTEQTAARELSRFFDPEIAAKIKGSEQEIRVGTGEMRDAAVLNLDMRGFTKLVGQASADEVIGLLAEYQARMVPVIQKHGGTIDKFLGDGIMATFGATVPSQTYASDALAALEEALREARDWQAERVAEGRPSPSVNGAVATGRILFGAVGDETRLEYTVIGDAVNLSAKLEKANKELGSRAVCDVASYELALKQGFQSEVERPRHAGVELAGIARPMDIVVLSA